MLEEKVGLLPVVAEDTVMYVITPLYYFFVVLIASKVVKSRTKPASDVRDQTFRHGPLSKSRNKTRKMLPKGSYARLKLNTTAGDSSPPENVDVRKTPITPKSKAKSFQKLSRWVPPTRYVPVELPEYAVQVGGSEVRGGQVFLTTMGPFPAPV